jgi:hypothetical protein
MEDHCSFRYVIGTDPEEVENRVAFIEKTPRVRVKPYTEYLEDHKNWEQGPKGCSPEYGTYKPSRDWCDKRLLELGYEFEE